MTENNIEVNEELPPASRLTANAEDPVVVDAPVVVEEPKDEVITTPNPVSTSNEESAGNSIGNDIPSGAFSTSEAKPVVKKTAAKPKFNKEDDNKEVVVFSEKSIYFPGVGRLTPGFNIVSAKSAKAYLRHKSVREASPEELARNYSN